jgi:very-short-patch-repair endonuclease
MKERLIAYAKDLRTASTDTERILWSHIRAKRLDGLKFRRQHQIGKYIVDFVCFEKMLIIELDGGQHAEPGKKEYDRERDNWLEKEGYLVLRFWDNEVLLNTKGVLTVIREHCLGHPPLNPLPSRAGKQEKTILSREGNEKGESDPTRILPL